MTYAEDGRRSGTSRLVYNKAKGAIDTVKSEPDPHDSLEDKIAWAILQALYVSIPEGERPMAWADMHEMHEARVRGAAKATMLTIANAGFIAAVEDLSRAQEREKVAAWMMANGFATGHGDTIEDLLVELGGQVKEMRDRA